MSGQEKHMYNLDLKDESEIIRTWVGLMGVGGVRERGGIVSDLGHKRDCPEAQSGSSRNTEHVNG